MTSRWQQSSCSTRDLLRRSDVAEKGNNKGPGIDTEMLPPSNPSVSQTDDMNKGDGENWFVRLIRYMVVG